MLKYIDICTPFVKTEDQLADILTKGLSGLQFLILLAKWECETFILQLEGECGCICILH